MNPLQPIDHAALRTNQAVIILLLLISFILNLSWLAGLVGLMMLGGALIGKPAFGWLYAGLLKPRGWLKPDVLMDNRQPHAFAQGFGGVVLLSAGFLFLSGSSIVGWGLVWLVIALASLNLFVGFCVGCAVYYWLNRLKVPGFTQSPPPGTAAGWRPRREEQG
ncbi:hypothetical protein BECAL_01004 [Bellilinea caldifistulae]|uniref:DUF4395 domain-containing protein n=1 Tax=Bellilinea caldifistulae TaxID=360411 RepID=UPI000781070A|nr:DUF4395 domain-containing protein [Bellilinea caldifistulae]GAP09851.1 hypothetical protein BECAL_01004 [Bellilinea caldifistulae]